MLRPLSAAVVAAAMTCTGLSQAADPWFDAAFKVRQPVRVQEPGIASRSNEYFELSLLVPAGTALDLAAELRVVDAAGVMVPSMLREHKGGVAKVLVMRTLEQGKTLTLYAYWSNAQATAPVYAFPAVPYVIFSYWDTGANISFLDSGEFDVLQKLQTMQLYGRIPLLYAAKAYGRGPYAQSKSLGNRFGVVGATCSIHDVLNQTSVYDDIAMMGFSNGSCTVQRMFAGNVPQSGNVIAPPVLSYVSQDLTPGQDLGVACSLPTVPGAGGVNELLSGDTGTAGCLVRWEPGTQFPRGKLRYRSYYGGLLGTSWTPGYTKAVQRALETVLQDNRVLTTNVGGPEFLCDGKARPEPVANETCDGIDNDCNGKVDDGVALCGGNVQGTACLGALGCGCNANTDCAGNTPRCDAETRRCSPVCNTDADCAGAAGTPRCGRALKLEGQRPDRCVQCVEDGDCTKLGKSRCDPYLGQCANALPDAGSDANSTPIPADAGPAVALDASAGNALKGSAPNGDGGCSCAVGPQSSGPCALGGGGMLGLALMVRRRRRRA
jgi:MYXO-CTERM domain-containing protein